MNIDQIAMYYISMYLSQQALQANGFFFNFNLVFNLAIGRKRKIFKLVSIDQNAMYYISMDMTQQALQINGKLLSNFGIVFRINYIFLK